MAARGGARFSRWSTALLGAAAALGCAAAVAAGEDAHGDLERVRFGVEAGATRMVLDLDRDASARVIGGADHGQRIVLNFRAIDARPGEGGEGSGLVRRWRLDPTAQGARLTLATAPSSSVRRRFLLPPADGVDHWRYVIDLQADAAPADQAANAVRAAMAPRSAAFARPYHVRKVVVIDAGHGGHDPGAQGRNTEEKTVTLATAEALAARLERDGRYKVVLTRDSDVFVPLAERVRIARRAGADLFISLHADSGESEQTHGASVYTLSEQGADRVGRVLSGHEWFTRAAQRDDDPAVGRILLDLSQRGARNQSSRFAGLLLDDLGARDIDLLPRSHRDAGYFVLLAPDVPAVLLEMGFITNPADEARLTDPAERRRLVGAVAEAIDQYFDQQMELAAR